MKLSYNWISDFIDLSDMKIADIADLLTMKTCEVEEYFEYRPDLENFTVALVKKVEKHTEADKLHICTVYDGKNTLQIVTGAPNVKEGKKYPLASVGALMPGGLEIKPAKLRGVESNGMLCSAEELEIENIVFEMGKKEDGLLTLPDDFTEGTSIRKALCLDDFILEIDNKSITHRPDLWSHYGFAREIASLTGKKLKEINQGNFPENPDVDLKLKKVHCNIESNAAIAYSCANFDGIAIQPSAIKIQARLLATGTRPKNNVVDISNYVMLEMGQPNHAFDRGKINGNIRVVHSKGKEKMELIDGKEVIVPSGIVLIEDQNIPVALGGVMGGKSTEVAETTTTLFLESATFHRKDIRKAVSLLGIRTEASQRFEKGQNPENSFNAIHRFAHLLKQSCASLRMGSVENIKTEEFKNNQIKTSVSHIQRKLGNVDIDGKKIAEILTSLGMTCTLTEDILVVNVPVYRSCFDIEIPEDLIEEIGRVIGYNQIAQVPVSVSCEVPAHHNSLRVLEHDLRQMMSKSYQFTEVYNYAFQSKSSIDLDTRYASTAVELKNPVHQDLRFMRISPLPGLLLNIAANQKKYNELAFFEMERIFLPGKGSSDEKSLPGERYFLAGLMYSSKSAAENLDTMHCLVTDLLTHTGFSWYDLNHHQLSESIFHPGRAGMVTPGENAEALAKWGEIHPGITDDFAIDKKLYYFEIFMENILKMKVSQKKPAYRPVPRYPAAEFEFTVIMDKKDLFSKLMDITGKPVYSNETALESVEHLTTYEGDSIAAGKKAVSLKVRWRNRSRTILHEELKLLQDNLISALSQAGFSLRS
ncbi:MAG: phenylalanine--tRNA ligase subunit beta [Spirochaetia bacterium]|nr:phenylalanine--tRNA ligase subunit beta [Spirochaetia bacterium]